jgi:3-oxoacyl-(acyl-carrier-protein) synthase
MDAYLSEHARDPVVVTGAGCECPVDGALSHDVDPVPYLRVRKTAKYLSKQDRLALGAASRAVRAAGLGGDELEHRTLIAMGVGPIPFQRDEALAVAELSRVEEAFSVDRFCREAYEAVNPMLLFACLPNMPAYHLSANLGIRGGYYLTYPSCGETYQALQHAVDSLREGICSVVLFGAVADQQNFLVHNHHRKVGQLLPAPDCASFLVLETQSHAAARQVSALARLERLGWTAERAVPQDAGGCYYGPVELPLAVARWLDGAGVGGLRHGASGSGWAVESEWRV